MNRSVLFVPLLLALAASTQGACSGAKEPAVPAIPDSLAVLRAVPDLRGRAVCQVDSIASPVSGVFIAHCDLGDGAEVTVHGDTMFSVERTSAPQVPDSGQSLLDYWNHHLRSEWEAHIGRRADNLNSDKSEYAERFEVVWDEPSRVRHLVTLERPKDRPLSLRHLAIDCRERDRRKQAIACW
jgi:hypothetical protein